MDSRVTVVTVPRSCSLPCVRWLRVTEHRQHLQSRVQHVTLTLPIIGASVRSVIKQLRGSSRVGATGAAAGGGDKATACDDVQRLLVEQWRLAIIKERLAAKQHRLVSEDASVSPSSLDELTIVTRIGRLRFLRLGGNK